MTCSICGKTSEHGNHKFGNIRANADGWFQQKDGTAFCPSHVPAWVQPWRARRDRIR